MNNHQTVFKSGSRSYLKLHIISCSGVLRTSLITANIYISCAVLVTTTCRIQTLLRIVVLFQLITAFVHSWAVTFLIGPLPSSWSNLLNLHTLQLTNVIADGPWSPWTFPQMRTLWLENLQVYTDGWANPTDWVKNSEDLSVFHVKDIPQMRMTSGELFSLLESANSTGLGIISVELGAGLTGPAQPLSDLSNIDRLSALLLRNNEIDGTLPQSWSKLTKTIAIDVSGNEISGTIPNEWANLTALVNVTGNKNVCGAVPGWFEEKLGAFNDSLLRGTSPVRNIRSLYIS